MNRLLFYLSDDIDASTPYPGGMKVYVAASSQSWKAARQEMEFFAQMGDEIAFDWTKEAELFMQLGGRSMTDAELAEKCIEAVGESDLLLMLWDGQPSTGMWVELGAALACGVPVVCWASGEAVGMAVPTFLRHSKAVLKERVPEVYGRVSEIAAGVRERERKRREKKGENQS